MSGGASSQSALATSSASASAMVTEPAASSSNAVQQAPGTSRKRSVLGNVLKRKRLSTSMVQQLRTGPAALMSPEQFRQEYSLFHKHLHSQRMELDPGSGAVPDLKVDDIALDTPFQVIEKAITQEVALFKAEMARRSGIAGTVIGSVAAQIADPVGVPPQCPIPDAAALQEELKQLVDITPVSVGIKSGGAEPNVLTEAMQKREIFVNSMRAPFVSVGPSEVILKVSLFHPQQYYKTQEFLVLASQPLTALRDRLECVSDDQPDSDSYPSGFFFIEGVFYNDLRDKRAKRLSDPVIHWVKEEGRYLQAGLSHFKAASMHETKFNDLKIRIGTHYLYQHQGNCRHTIIFTEMRMMHPADHTNAVAYPIKVFQSRMRRKKCGVCEVFLAKRVTYGDRLASTNPYFWCESCYVLFHYTTDGALLYDDFKVFELP